MPRSSCNSHKRKKKTSAIGLTQGEACKGKKMVRGVHNCKNGDLCTCQRKAVQGKPAAGHAARMEGEEKKNVQGWYRLGLLQEDKTRNGDRRTFNRNTR